MKLYIFIILFLTMIVNIDSTFSDVNCSLIKQKSAQTVCNITGIKTSCESKASACDAAFTKLSHLNWEKLSVRKNISSIAVKNDGTIEVNLRDSDSYIFLADVSDKEIGERLAADLSSTTVLASKTISTMRKNSFGMSAPCNETVATKLAGSEDKVTERPFWNTLDTIHKDAYKESPEKYFKDKDKQAKGACSSISYRRVKVGTDGAPDEYNWVKNSSFWEVDTATFAQRSKMSCNKSLDGKDWIAQVGEGVHFSSSYGLFNFSADGKKWSVNYDYRNRDHDDSKKDSKTMFATDGIQVSGANETSVSDDAYGMGFSMQEIKTCEFTGKEIKVLNAKIAKAKKENLDWKKVAIHSCRFEPDQMAKIRNEWSSIQKKVLAKCMLEMAPIVAGSTSTCNSPDSSTGTCRDEKDVDESTGIPGMTIKNCSNVEVDGKRYPHLYVVERLEGGKRYAYGAATIEDFDRNGKKSATLVYNWEYDNASKAKFAQTGGSQKIPKTIQGESKLPVFIDDNDNVVSLKSKCFRHSYTRTSDGGKPIGDGGAFYGKSGGGIEKLECVN